MQFLKCNFSHLNNKLNTFDFRGQTPLHKAAAYKWRGICCMLVAAGASLDVTDHRGLTPRLLALQSDDHDLAAYLESK